MLASLLVVIFTIAVSPTLLYANVLTACEIDLKIAETVVNKFEDVVKIDLLSFRTVIGGVARSFQNIVGISLDMQRVKRGDYKLPQESLTVKQSIAVAGRSTAVAYNELLNLTKNQAHKILGLQFVALKLFRIFLRGGSAQRIEPVINRINAQLEKLDKDLTSAAGKFNYSENAVKTQTTLVRRGLLHAFGKVSNSTKALEKLNKQLATKRNSCQLKQQSAETYRSVFDNAYIELNNEINDAIKKLSMENRLVFIEYMISQLQKILAHEHPTGPRLPEHHSRNSPSEIDVNLVTFDTKIMSMITHLRAIQTTNRNSMSRHVKLPTDVIFPPPYDFNKTLDHLRNILHGYNIVRNNSNRCVAELNAQEAMKIKLSKELKQNNITAKFLKKLYYTLTKQGLEMGMGYTLINELRTLRVANVTSIEKHVARVIEYSYLFSMVAYPIREVITELISPQKSREDSISINEFRHRTDKLREKCRQTFFHAIEKLKKGKKTAEHKLDVVKARCLDEEYDFKAQGDALFRALEYDDEEDIELE